MRTQVAIIGGGPAGLLLSHILDRNGVDSIVLERQTRAHVLERIRAGVLEAGTVALLREVGLGERMDREGQPHDGSGIAWENRPHFLIDTRKYTGKPMMAYGQTAITEDLYAARDARRRQIVDEAADVQLHDTDVAAALRDLSEGGESRIGSTAITSPVATAIMAWPGIDPGRRAQDVRERLSVRLARHHVGDAAVAGDLLLLSQPRLCARLDAQPDAEPLLHPMRPRHAARGLAGRPFLAGVSARCPKIWRTYRHWAVDRKIDRAVAQFCRRADALRRAVSCRRRRPYRAADRRQGLNLAVSDVFYLSRALTEFYRTGRTDYLDSYSETALRRVWGAARMSWWLTMLLHRFPDETPFEQQMRINQFDYLLASEHAQASLAEQYVGLPY